MQAEPVPLQLLLAARAWLLDEVLPHVTEEKRYDALLIASAMAIVARELKAADAVLDQERGRDIEHLRKLYPEVPEDGAQAGERLRAWTERLVRDIRAGRFDRPGSEREALRRLLRDDTVETLKRCNPRYLELEDLG